MVDGPVILRSSSWRYGDGDDDDNDDDTDDDTDDDHDHDTDDDNDHKNDSYTAGGAAPGASVPSGLRLLVQSGFRSGPVQSSLASGLVQSVLDGRVVMTMGGCGAKFSRLRLRVARSAKL